MADPEELLNQGNYDDIVLDNEDILEEYTKPQENPIDNLQKEKPQNDNSASIETKPKEEPQQQKTEESEKNNKPQLLDEKEYREESNPIKPDNLQEDQLKENATNINEIKQDANSPKNDIKELQLPEESMRHETEKSPKNELDSHSPTIDQSPEHASSKKKVIFFLEILNQQKVNKWNFETSVSEDRLRNIVRKQKELSQEIERLRVDKSPEELHKSIEKIKRDLEKLEPVMLHVSPDIKKKKRKITVVGASELQKIMYTEDKQKKSLEFIEKMKQEKLETLKEFELEMSLRTQLNQAKVLRIKKQLEDLQEKEKAIRREHFEKTLQDIKKRDEERKKNAEDWKKAYQEYKAKKPLFVIKEEIFKTQVDLENKKAQEALEKRKEFYKPMPDNLFKDWAKTVSKKREELANSLKEKRLEELSRRNLNQSFSYYRGKFHDLVQKEEELSKSMTNIHASLIKEMQKKRIEYFENIKKKIKIKTKKYVPEYETRQPKPTDLKIKKVQNHRLNSQRELYELGNKLMRDGSKFARKSPPNDRSSSSKNLSSVHSNPLGSGRGASLPPIYRSTPELTIPKKKIDYLKEIKVQNKEKKKKTELEDLLDRNIPTSEKFNLVKANIEKFEQEAKVIENKIKYSKNKNQAEADKDNLDRYYLNTIKAKIAILNGFRS